MASVSNDTKIKGGRLLGSRELFPDGEDVFIDMSFGDPIPAVPSGNDLQHPIDSHDPAEVLGWHIAEQFYGEGFGGDLKLRLYREGSIGNTLYEAKFKSTATSGILAVSPSRAEAAV